MKVQVVLTEEHIKKGCESRHGGSCPMYWAISEALGNRRIHISSQYVSVSASPNPANSYLLPEEARNWIQEWDESFRQPDRDWESFKPIEFKLSMDVAV